MARDEDKGTDYFGWGLTFRSELTISGGAPIRTGEPDVRIALGRATLTGRTIECPPYRFGDGEIFLDVPDVARYLIEPDRIVVEPAAGAASDHVEALLIATAIPALLWLRGAYVLHASCTVAPDGKAVAFTGPSGSGKSLLCAQLVRSGWSLVGEDSITLKESMAELSAAGLPAALHISRPPPEPREPRTLLEVPPEQHRREALLNAIFDLKPRAGAPLAVRRLNRVAALTALLTNRHRPAVPHGLRMEGDCLAKAASIAAVIPVRTVEFDPAELSAAALIERLGSVNL